MKSIALGPILLLVGCSHVTPKIVSMELPFAPELVEEMQQRTGRAPASMEVSDLAGKSPRRVYFSALYHQYLTLSHHLSEDSQVQSCPQFHHDKVETDDSRIPEFSLYGSVKKVDSGKDFFPETVFNKKFSLKDHQVSMFEELSVLCEEGVSDNYYKFDNLITHYADKKSFHSRPDSMKSVLKIPVFANYYLLQMLQPSQGVSFVHPEEKKIITMTQTHWFESYVAEAHRLRSNLIKNHMVQR